MATKTWALKVGQFGTVQVKGLKKEVEHLFYSGFSPILKIQNYATEINGIIGGEEHKHTYMSMFTPSGGHVDVEAWQADMTELFKGFPNPIIDLSGTMTRCQELFTKHCPVIDKRKTQEQVNAENAEYLEARAANEAKRKEEEIFWLTKYSDGEGTQEIAIPQGMMAVCCQATFNDSDAMTDYYSPHRSIGPCFLLAVVPVQAQTERLAREIIERYPDLSALEWAWHTETYSGGHGNYLMSGGVEAIPEQAYNGREEVVYSLEIQANKYAGGREGHYPFHGYTPMASIPTTGAIGGGSGGHASYKLNPDKNGVEVKFTARPADDTISMLKSSGFRWSKFQKLWYARQSDRTIGVAEKICQICQAAA